MPRTFQDDLRDDLSHAFLDPSEFGETITYHPLGGQSRQINASITEDVQIEAGDTIHQSTERIEVLVIRDATLGVVDAQIGDGIQREGDPVRFAFSGEVLNRSRAAQTLVFVRSRPYALGARTIEP